MTPDSPAPVHSSWELIGRYLTGDSTADEERRAREILAHSADDQFLHTVGERLAASYPSSDEVDAAVERLKRLRRAASESAINVPGDQTRQTRTHVSRSALGSAFGGTSPLLQRLRPVLGLGAAALLATVITYVARPTATPSTFVAARVYETTTGQQIRITLPDGSIALLAPQSRLGVATDFARKSRRVQLTGQAYFDVQPSNAAAFVVHTGTVTTRVLGTAFDVRHYGGDADVRVAVVRGKVAVTGAKKGVTLTAGTVGYVTDSSAVSTGDSDVTGVAAWTDGQLVFREAPVRSVLTGLSRWYGYEFRLADTALANRPVTVTFDINDRPGTFELLRHLLGVTLQVEDTVVTLVPRRNSARGVAVPRHTVPHRWSIPPQVGR
jgi:transmembrane sensor